MTGQEYQKFTTTTAIYPKEQAREYLYLGLVGELGELCNKLKKQIRDNVNLRDDISAEMGDVCWYLAEICNLDNKEFETSRFLKEYPGGLFFICLVLSDFFAMSSKWLATESSCSAAVPSLCGLLLSLADVLSLDIENEVLPRNVAKLSARKAANTITGSGDHR